MGTTAVALLLCCCGGILLLLGTADAACSTHDAKWKDGNKGPTVTQPSKNDPTKVMVKWDTILDNSRCVDEFTLWAWKFGEAKEQGQKIVIKDMNTLSNVVTVDPCVDYSFAVDFLEKDMTHTDQKSSAIAKFTSQAVPQIVDQDKKNFQVGYAYDPLRKVYDLGKVSVRFSRAILKNPSCVKHIEISGAVVPKVAVSPFALDVNAPSGVRSAAFARELSPNHGYYLRSNSSGRFNVSIPQAPVAFGGNQYNPSHPGSHPGHYHPPGSNIGGHPGFLNPPGGSSQYPGYPGSSNSGGWGSGGYPGSGYPGTGSTNCPYGGTWCNNYPGYPSHGGHGGENVYPGRPASPGYPGYPSGYPSGSGSGYPGGYFTTTARPPYFDDRGKREIRTTPKTTTANPRELYPGSGGGASYVVINGKALPPYLHDFIEVTAPIKPCHPYKITLKIITPSDSVMAEVKDLYLAQLTQQTETYTPPHLSKLLKVEPASPGAILQSPTVKVLPNFGVPDSCLEDFFYSVDAHMAMLERDLNYHMAQEAKNYAYGETLLKKLEEQKSGQLSRFGCACNSTLIRVNTTDAKLFGKYKEIYGIYSYEGMQNGRPYYVRLDINSTLPPLLSRPPQQSGPGGAGLVTGGSGGRHKRFIGKVEGSQQPAGSRPGSPPPPNTYSGAVSGAPSYPPPPPPGSSSYPQGPPPQGDPSLTSSLVGREAAPSSVKPYYLYWDAKTLAWTLGEKMEGKDAIFMTQKKSAAKCPADPQTLKKWQYTGTLTWHDDENMYAACALLP